MSHAMTALDHSMRDEAQRDLQENGRAMQVYRLESVNGKLERQFVGTATGRLVEYTEQERSKTIVPGAIRPTDRKCLLLASDLESYPEAQDLVEVDGYEFRVIRVDTRMAQYHATVHVLQLRA